MKEAIAEIMANALNSEQAGVPVDWKALANQIANYAVNVGNDMEETMAKDKLWMDAATKHLTEEELQQVEDAVADR